MCCCLTSSDFAGKAEAAALSAGVVLDDSIHVPAKVTSTLKIQTSVQDNGSKQLHKGLFLTGFVLHEW